MSASENRFMSWRDMVFTPLVSGAIMALSVVLAWLLARQFSLDSFLGFVLFFFLQAGFTLGALKILRVVMPLKEGVYSYQTDPVMCFGWNLYGYLCITHLNLFYDKILLPIPFRKGFYKLMGADVGKGIIPISGQLLDPHLITIGTNAHIGEDAMLTPHAVTADSRLYIGRITVGEGAMIGAKSTIMPGVNIGKGAMVNAMSLVTMNTTIAAYEVWGGIPARKLKGLQPAGPAAQMPPA